MRLGISETEVSWTATRKLGATSRIDPSRNQRANLELGVPHESFTCERGGASRARTVNGNECPGRSCRVQDVRLTIELRHAVPTRMAHSGRARWKLPDRLRVDEVLQNGSCAGLRVRHSRLSLPPLCAARLEARTASTRTGVLPAKGRERVSQGLPKVVPRALIEFSGKGIACDP